MAAENSEYTDTDQLNPADVWRGRVPSTLEMALRMAPALPSPSLSFGPSASGREAARRNMATETFGPDEHAAEGKGEDDPA